MAVQSSRSSLALQTQCCNYVRKALASLDKAVDEADCVQLAQLILPSMVGPWRFFTPLSMGSSSVVIRTRLRCWPVPSMT